MNLKFSLIIEMNLYGRVLASLLPLLYLVNGSALKNDVLQSNSNVRVAETSRRAAQWLLNRRNSQLHWGRLTNSQVLLALTQSDHFNSSLPEFQLAIAQLDIHFLLDRLRFGDLELYSDRLIPLAVTLTSLCSSPTHYYDYDLLDGLLDNRRKTGNFTFASEMLAVCGGDGIIPRTHIRRLVWLLNPKMWTGPSSDIHSIDTLSMVLMATGCVAQHYNHPYILPFADQLVRMLISKQQRDGSFNNGNAISTALVVQALRIHGLSVNVNSTVQAAVDWIASAQLEDGSFDSDLMVTSEVLLALSPMGGRAHIHLSRCKDNQTEVTEVSGSSQQEQVSFQFLIWVGQQPGQKRKTISFKVPVNSTVYEALLLAQVDGLLRFESREYSFGHFIVTINNTPQLSATDQYWMIYVLPPSKLAHSDLAHSDLDPNDLDPSKLGDLDPSESDPSDQPDSKFLMKTSVSSHKIKGGERILFWYRSSV